MDLPFNLQENISLPLLIRDWINKTYPKRCCISVREYHDSEINFTTQIETTTLTELHITPNSKLTSAKGCAYRIDVDMKCVDALYEEVEEHSLQDGYENRAALSVGSRTIWLDIDHMDWRAPDFFDKLKKAIGCQCRKKKKRPPPSRTS